MVVKPEDFNCTIQELKLLLDEQDSIDSFNFNCTIQELKPHLMDGLRSEEEDFNCTIQELKRKIDALTRVIENKFQLHHTGIKTTERGSAS